MTASAGRMSEPPLVLDAARVVEYAPLEGAARAESGSAVVGGVAVDLRNVAGLVIAEGLADGLFYLLLCNERWETLAAGSAADAAAARAEADRACPGASRSWRVFREPTDAERAEIESTRTFLRELLASDPDA